MRFWKIAPQFKPMPEVHNKIPFDFSDVDLIRKSGFRTKDKKLYFNPTSVEKLGVTSGTMFFTYQKLYEECEYENKVTNQWLPCEKVGN